MDKEAAVYAASFIGWALEDPKLVERIKEMWGTRGVGILHRAEMAICTEHGLEPWKPEGEKP